MRRLRSALVDRAAARNQSGIALITALVFMILISVTVFALLTLAFANRASSTALEETARRAAVADAAINQATIRIGKNYVNPKGDFDQNDRDISAQFGTKGRDFDGDGAIDVVDCGDGTAANTFRFTIDNRVARVTCEPLESPGFIRRVKLLVDVGDSGGQDLQRFGYAMIRIVDVNPATGTRDNGRTVQVDNLVLCRAEDPTEAKVAGCTTTP